MLYKGGSRILNRMGKRRSVLCDIQIKKEMEKGAVVVIPFESSHLSNCSYDVSLGEFYYRNISTLEAFNPWVEDHVRKYWGTSLEASKIKDEEEARKYGLGIGERYILVLPGETILGHTNEFIGGKGNITTMMKARSSMGRCGVTVCKCAGWGDIGYVNRWTMEISNTSSSTIVLPVGAKVAQIVFLYSSTPEKIYRGKYQDTSDMERLVSDWNPSSMLPKLYKEKREIESPSKEIKILEAIKKVEEIIPSI